jgi:hypothetical protein
VRLKAGAYKKCFAYDSFKLDEDDTEVPSGLVNDKVCSRFDVWPYDVILFDGTDKDNPKEMGREDPLVVINH